MSDDIIFCDGTHRICTPEDTLARIIPLMPELGITRIADVTGLDTIGVPVVMVYRPNSRSISVSQGKGKSLTAAKVSGLMESIEGFHAEHILSPLRFASYKEMNDYTQVIDANSLVRAKRSPFHLDYPIEWIEGEDLNSQTLCWLPFEMVHTNYTLPGLCGSGCFPASSNGLASGNSMDEATVHGICEIIERDALSLWHFAGEGNIDKTAIDKASIDDPLCNALLDKLDNTDLQSFLWDITSDSGIPSYLAVIIDGSSHTQHVGVGSGTHLCKEVALLRALHEAVQVRTTYIVGARDDITPDEYSQSGIASKQNFYNRLINKCSFSAQFSRTPSVNTYSVKNDLNILKKALEHIGVPQILRVDLTRAALSIAVVRIVIPGLETPHDDPAYVPGARVSKLRMLAN